MTRLSPWGQTLAQLHELVHELAHPHQLLARQVGERFHRWDHDHGVRDSFQTVALDASLRGHVNGAGGELAFGNVQHLTWPGPTAQLGKFGVCDYPVQGIEVKTASGWGRSGLPIRHTVWEPMRLDPFYVLVWGRMPRFTVVGWIPALDLAAALDYLRPNRRTNCKYVPWQWLRPLPRNGGPPWPEAAEHRPTRAPTT